MFCGRSDNYYEIIPICPSCLEGLSFSGEGPGILLPEGILPGLLRRAEQGEEELLDPFVFLLALDYGVRGLKGRAIRPGVNHVLDEILAKKTSFFLRLPLVSNHPNALVVGVYWSGELRNEYPSDRILALVE